MSKLYRIDEYRVGFDCPGCGDMHVVPVARDNDRHPIWGWNGDMSAPTFTPSIRVNGVQPLTEDECQRLLNGEKIQPIPFCCHSFVVDGKIQFLGDCTHKLAGQTVELPDCEETA